MVDPLFKFGFVYLILSTILFVLCYKAKCTSD